MAFSENTDRIYPLLHKTAQDSREWRIPENFMPNKPLTLGFLNQHGVNTAVRNEDFYSFLMASDYLLRDGIGVKLALKLFKLGETENLNGTDLISILIRHYHGRKLAIFGASADTINACRERLEKEGVRNIVAMEHGFHEDGFYLKLCETVRPDIIILCMGMPRQEILAGKLEKEKLAGMIICGGGWADFYSGVKIRAPEWMRKLSLEWLHRLLKEPRRLGKRYTIDIIYYFYLLAKAYAISGPKK